MGDDTQLKKKEMGALLKRVQSLRVDPTVALEDVYQATRAYVAPASAPSSDRRRRRRTMGGNDMHEFELQTDRRVRSCSLLEVG